MYFQGIFFFWKIHSFVFCRCVLFLHILFIFIVWLLIWKVVFNKSNVKKPNIFKLYFRYVIQRSLFKLKNSLHNKYKITSIHLFEYISCYRFYSLQSSCMETEHSCGEAASCIFSLPGNTVWYRKHVQSQCDN